MVQYSVLYRTVIAFGNVEIYETLSRNQGSQNVADPDQGSQNFTDPDQGSKNFTNPDQGSQNVLDPDQGSKDNMDLGSRELR